MNENYPLPNLIGKNDKGVSYFPMVNGLKMHFRCYKNQDPNFSKGEIAIFDSGFPFFSSAYGNVIELMSKKEVMSAMGIESACFFDRYGYGWSDLSPEPLGVENFVSMLKQSIDLIPFLKNKRFFYVGWSYGGLNAQMFSMKYPQLIKGILTIDSSFRNYIDPLFNSQLENQIQQLESVISLPNDMFKLICGQGMLTQDQGWFTNNSKLIFPSIEITQKIITNPNQNMLKALHQELSTLTSSSQRLDELFNSSSIPNNPLGNLPMVVVSNSNDTESWVSRQHQLSKLSKNSFQFSIYSTHFIPIIKPEVVIVQLSNLILRSTLKIPFCN
ncbi:hypothetical protein DDB_G0270878 [Dictyostelium discoideum AX4]|uniref:AB hydrolase-1 domain-containing protein n=1 Tax=Dictyostelium discoideum TaxID=44689 RepID=Q55DU6_DICDI|nr:hypothetical protein DDB_G0270878 [Dictyostelium discoideum AX4]EAL72789.1 hypothetical protein DDB_G0270878 [Dictyostelium discoideum AX4]|eukprot:XP_646035.1 hypothetical protein DDB_G0270878 [Dictyostelium discoideum AX4]